jgi:hypothetical protein
VDTEPLADTIRHTVAWWRLAADALDAGEVTEAHDHARLGTDRVVDTVPQPPAFGSTVPRGRRPDPVIIAMAED